MGIWIASNENYRIVPNKYGILPIIDNPPSPYPKVAPLAIRKVKRLQNS